MLRHGFQDQPLAIVGMGCRLPGANNLDEYWNLIRSGGSGIAEIPPHRLDQKLYYAPEKGVLGKTYTRLGGIVETRRFDRETCRVSEDLINACDSSHVTMLDVAAATFRNAGYDPLALPLRNTGVFIGHARGSPLIGDLAYATHAEEVVQHLRGIPNFEALASERREAVIEQVVERIHREKPRRLERGGPDVACSGVAGIVSRAFGLSGPYMVVDAACASSFVALGMAAAALHHGRIEMALVGGASYSSWFSLVLFSQAHALSSSGSYPFDARADGFVSSDGYAAVLIKTLARALADGDRVHGVVRGIGMSSDGRGKSLWAPRKEGQVEAIRRAYYAGLDPSRVQYVEAHGTSTQVGDATELDALCQVIGKQLSSGARIPVASVKANIGHTRETAGVAGLIKTLLAMQHQVMPRATNFQTPNPEIPWERIPFFVPTEEIEWPAVPNGQPRRAVVDAFGIGGLNVHVVVEDLAAGNATGAFSPSRPTQTDALGGNGSGPIARDEADQIAVIGLGGIFPGARTISAFWDLLVSGRDPKCEAPASRWNAELFHTPGSAGPWRSPTRLGGFITDFAYDWKTHRIPPRQIETSDPLKFMLMDAADQALRDAGYDHKSFDRRRAAVVVGTMFGGDFANQLNTALRLPEFQQTLEGALRAQGVLEERIAEISARFAERIFRNYPAIHDETGSYTSSTLASQVAKTLDLMGGAFAIDADSASSLAAVGTAVDLLRTGACDLVLCFGGQRYLDVTIYEQYAARDMLAAGAPRAGFDAAADGCVPGEGVGVVLLKRLSDARRDQDKIRAIVRGYGAGADADSVGNGMQLAAERALASSATSPGHVAVVEAAGLGIPRVDSEEARALAATYGSVPRERPLLVGTVASQIGYSHGASGMASLLKATLALEQGQMPASAGFCQSAESVAAAGRGALQMLAGPASLRSAGDTAVGVVGVSALTQRGLAYHVLIERPEIVGAQARLSSADWRILRLGAASPVELAARLTRSVDEAESLFARTAAMQFHPGDGVRLGIVAESAEALGKKLRLAAEQIHVPSARLALEDQGIYCHKANGKPRVAFVFSGQGSQYPGMLRELVQESHAAAGMVREIDGTLGRLGYGSFAKIAWESGEELGQDVWRTQISVLLADLIVHAALDDLGIVADVVAGHSFGEYAALVAAGVWTLEQAIRVTRARAEAIERATETDGGMLAVAATPERVQGLAAGIDEVWVANHNSPDQTVMAGRRAGLAELEARLAHEGIESQWLPIPRPFHSPLMQPVQAALAEAWKSERLLPPRIPLLSSVTNRYVADPHDIRRNLSEQLTAPVRYVELVTRLVDDGVTAIVEVGPRQVLTRLHRRILENRRTTLVAGDQPKRPGRSQLFCVQAALESAGLQTEIAASNGKPSMPSPAAGGPGARTQSEIVHFDATQKRRERMRRAAEETPSPATAAAGEAKAPADEMEKFLVNFVCEQTGYPPEIVELDADLEADLGLDSIKKAQLFGELREHFSIQSVAKLSLDDFPTLRHVLNFLREHAQPVAAKASAEGAKLETAARAAAQEAPEAKVVHQAAPAKSQADTSDALSMLNVVRLSGSPYEMGREHARTQADAIRVILNRYADLMDSRMGEVQELYGAMSEPERLLDEVACEELRGLADGLEMPSDYLLAYNIGIDPVFVPGCVQFAITGRANGAEGLLHATNEDWILALGLPDCLKRMVQVRHPTRGNPHLIFSAAGQLGGINGINASGLAVTSTLLLDRPRHDNTASGKMHSIVVRAVLEQATDIPSAIEVIRSIDKMWAWSMCLSHHAEDRVCYLEYDGSSLLVDDRKDSVLTTNHCLLHTPAVKAPEHSQHRFQRLQQLLFGGEGSGYTFDQAKEALRDRFDRGRQRVTAHLTMNTVQRADNQASIVMRPAQGEVWLTPGPLASGAVDRYFQLNVRELLAAPAATDVKQDDSAQQQLAEPGDEDQPEASEQRSQRFVLRLVDAPLSGTDKGLSFSGPSLIFGENPTAVALRRRLAEGGLATLDLPIGSAEETLAALEGHWATAPATQLLLTTGRDEEASQIDDASAWNRRRERGVMFPYLVCQRWLRLLSAAKLIDQATLVAVTGLGGDFGLSGRGSPPEGGGLAGLLKAIRHEYPQLTVKVIDAPLEEAPAAVAAAVCRELSQRAGETEVAAVRGKRRVLRAAPRLAIGRRKTEIARGGAWVVSGGATGITAAVGSELGKRFELDLHLLGRSPLPRIDPAWHALSVADLKQLKMTTAFDARKAGKDPTAAWRSVERAIELDKNLRALADAGVRATYHPCDISDRAALARVLARIREAAGPIQGVLHGAGVESAARFDRKTPKNVAATLAGKVDGAVALMELTKDDPLAHFVAFGSVSGRFGGVGQTDYSLASDLLAKLVDRFRCQRPSCAAVTIHWPGWDEIGMAVRPESKLVMDGAGVRLLPPQEGIEHVIAELEAGCPEGEIVILSPPNRLDRDHIIPPLAARRAYRKREELVARSPMISGIYELHEGQSLIAEVQLDPVADPFLREHQLQEVPILPGVICMELLAEAAAILVPDQKVTGLADVEFLSGFRFYSDKPQTGLVMATRTADGVSCELVADFFNREGRLTDPHRLHMRGMVEMSDRPTELAYPPLPAAKDWHAMEYLNLAQATERGRLYMGPPFQYLREVSLEPTGCWGRIEAPPHLEIAGDRQGDHWIVPSVSLDASFQAAGAMLYFAFKTLQLPRALKRLQLGRLPRAGERCIVRHEMRERSQEQAQFDLVLYGEDQSVILAVDGFRFVIVPPKATST